MQESSLTIRKVHKNNVITIQIRVETGQIVEKSNRRPKDISVEPSKNNPKPLKTTIINSPPKLLHLSPIVTFPYKVTNITIFQIIRTIENKISNTTWHRYTRND